eukprot:CAMPEP_0194272422 /NCGR_PEP_ID=MMETSP0169-20130528/5998_1 /TAXON_ID=218684 /ORGANISM="Corethron pennatum, Strain L29A3" /LENGTH=328 /DNA_ID=CAMNT_0039015081 /DNA_START=55 /DNA_END=1041 /DNA_ORIENTATION=-
MLARMIYDEDKRCNAHKGRSKITPFDTKDGPKDTKEITPFDEKVRVKRKIHVIERDGERFHHCLEYMKNGKIVLPAGVSRTAVVEDMEYFGFDTGNIKIEVDLSSLVELGHHIPQACSEYTELRIKKQLEKIREAEKQIEEAKKQIECLKFAERHVISTSEGYHTSKLYDDKIFKNEDLNKIFDSFYANTCGTTEDSLGYLYEIFAMHGMRVVKLGSKIVPRVSSTHSSALVYIVELVIASDKNTDTSSDRSETTCSSGECKDELFYCRETVNKTLKRHLYKNLNESLTANGMKIRTMQSKLVPRNDKKLPVGHESLAYIVELGINKS